MATRRVMATLALIVGSIAALATPAAATDPTELENVSQIDAGTYSTCGLLDSGTIRCWGYNGYGQLGDGTTTEASVPRGVVGISDATTIGVGATTRVQLCKTASSDAGDGIPGASSEEATPQTRRSLSPWTVSTTSISSHWAPGTRVQCDPVRCGVGDATRSGSSETAPPRTRRSQFKCPDSLVSPTLRA